MKIYIKNMVCDRCIMAVRNVLEKHGLLFESIRLGEVELLAPPTMEQSEALAQQLKLAGFILLDDKKAQVVEKVKNAVIELVHQSKGTLNLKLSVLLSEKLNLNYHFITRLFSTVEGMTIERYVMLQRIERAKELIKYKELNLGEIADLLGYSSTQHLSQQFKKLTGLTPSQFLKLKDNKRKPLDQLYK